MSRIAVPGAASTQPFSAKGVSATRDAIRAATPLVHNITSAVVANGTANALLALGASPAMAEDADEMDAFVPVCAALVVNLGMLIAPRAQAIRRAARAALFSGRPWVLDPVAAGVHSTRLALARELLECRPAAIRGNASEVIALASRAGAGAGAGGGRGVDSTATSDTARASAAALARRCGAVVAVTGAVDYISDGARLVACSNGHAMMTRVTGLGCAASAIVGACLAVEPDALVATAHALALTGVAGEIAAERCRGPGSLHLEFLDALYLLDAATLGARVRLALLA